MRRGRLALVSVVLASTASGLAATAATTGSALSPANPAVTWTDGPLNGTSAGGCTDTPATCSTTNLSIDVPRSYWDDNPGGVSVRIAWTAPETELDLHVLDATGRELAEEIYGGRTHQQVYLDRPAPGTYTVQVVAFTAVAATYTATARLTRDTTRAARTVAATMDFRDGLVDPQIVTLEPGVALAPNGDAYANAPWGTTELSSMAWRSRDRGQTFSLLSSRAAGIANPAPAPCLGALGGADSDLVVDKTGRIYFAALQPTAISVAVSTDNGASWSCNPVANSSPENDRPWLAPAPTADGDGSGVDAYLSYIDLVSGQLPLGRDIKPARIHIDRTADGGQTWSPAGETGVGGVPVPGPIFTTNDGVVYQPYSANEGVWLARSTDGGATFTTKRVSQRVGDTTNNWIGGAADAAGNVYLAWVDSGSFQTLFARSLDGGDTWSRPIRLTPPGTASMLPWITAGDAGDVAVAWYGARSNGLPDYAFNETPWHIWVARSLTADVDRPGFAIARATTTPVHVGPLCTLSCTGDHSGLGDFLKVAIAPSGGVVLSYADNARIDAAEDPPYSYLVVSRQTAGYGMTNSAPPPPRERRRDAPGPLDLTTVPDVDPSTRTLTLAINSPAGSLDNALSTPVNVNATDAYWLAIWSCGLNVEYAGMHLGNSGDPPDFFGGVDPTAVDDKAGLKEIALSYPAEFALDGAIDEQGNVTIDLDRKTFGFDGCASLRRLQAFSLVGTGPVAQANLLTTADATPARDVQL